MERRGVKSGIDVLYSPVKGYSPQELSKCHAQLNADAFKAFNLSSTGEMHILTEKVNLREI